MRFKTPLAAILATLITLPSIADDDEFRFSAKLRGSNEIPTPVITDTRGNARFEVDDEDGEIEFSMNIRHAIGIFGGPGAHIHCGDAESNGPVAAFLAAGFGELAGLNGKVKVKGTLTNDNILPTDCGTNVSELLQAMLDGNTYVNVHSNRNPAGEIRGQIVGKRKNKDDDDDD